VSFVLAPSALLVAAACDDLVGVIAIPPQQSVHEAGSHDAGPDCPEVSCGPSSECPFPGAQQCEGGSQYRVCGPSCTWGEAGSCGSQTCEESDGGAPSCVGTVFGSGSVSCEHGSAGDLCPGLSCCRSLDVPGGTYDRDYWMEGGVAEPATVTAFSLDQSTR
jgi:hypothetical protein